MNCPNCNSDLMNVNGRYVCVECGKEFSENELQNIPANTQPIQPTSIETPNIEPSQEVVNDFAATQVHNEEAREDVGQEESVMQPEIQSEPVKVENVSNPVVPAIEPISTTPQETIAPPVLEAQPESLDTKNSLVNEVQTTAPVAPETPSVSEQPIDPFEITDPLGTQQAGYIDPGLMVDTNSTPIESPVENTAPTSAPISSANRSLYILLGVGIFLFLSLLGGSIFAYFSLTKKAEPAIINKGVVEWQAYNAADYSALFPFTPEESKETLAVNDQSIKLEKVSSKQDGTTYAIAFGTLPEAFTPSAELTEFSTALAKTVNGRVNKTEAIEVEGQKALNFEIETENSTIKGKVILKGNKIYYLEYISKSDTSDNYLKFIDSFSFSANQVEE